MRAFLRYVRAKYKAYRTDISYKSYTADLLKEICEGITQAEVKSRWIDLIYPPEEINIEEEREKAIKAFSRG